MSRGRTANSLKEVRKIRRWIERNEYWRLNGAAHKSEWNVSRWLCRSRTMTPLVVGIRIKSRGTTRCSVLSLIPFSVCGLIKKFLEVSNFLTYNPSIPLSGECNIGNVTINKTIFCHHICRAKPVRVKFYSIGKLCHHLVSRFNYFDS